MPLRLPLRRRIGPKAKAPFRRRAPPTPQATRLMQVSLGAGVVLVVILALVFIPRALVYDVRPPSVTLAVTKGDPYVVRVARVNVLLGLATYHAELNATNGTQVNIIVMRPLTAGSWWSGNISYDDVDQDGRLSVGDTFTIRKLGPTWQFRLFLFHESRGDDTAVGFISFSA